MGWFVSDERIPVEMEGCRCHGSPHDHDTVYLRAELDPAGGFAAMAAINAAQVNPDVLQERIGRAYAEHGIVDWTFLDDDGEPVPVTKENIRRLSWDVIYPIADKGDDIYAEALLRPLVARRLKSSPNGRTARSTSATRKRSTVRRKPSKPSTTATTQPTPLRSMSSVGDSSTSPRKRLASA